MAIDVTLDHLKVLAHQSKAELAREGLELGHKQCLDLQARIHGFANYEVAKAELDNGVGSESKLKKDAGASGLKKKPIPDLPADVQEHACNPVERVLGDVWKRDEGGLAKRMGASKQAVDYLYSNDRCRAADVVAYLMLGWDVPDRDAYDIEEPSSGADFKACREVMEWPESKGRYAELARLEGHWVEVAANWQALCELQDEDHEEVGDDEAEFDGLVGGSLAALAMRSNRREFPERRTLFDVVRKGLERLYHETDWSDWEACTVSSDLGEARFSMYAEGKDSKWVSMPKNHGFVIMVKFGEMRRLCRIPMKYMV